MMHDLATISRLYTNGTLLLTLIKLNHSMNELHHVQWSVWWNWLSIREIQRLHRWSSEMEKQFYLTWYLPCDTQYIMRPRISEQIHL